MLPNFTFNHQKVSVSDAKKNPAIRMEIALPIRHKGALAELKTRQANIQFSTKHQKSDLLSDEFAIILCVCLPRFKGRELASLAFLHTSIFDFLSTRAEATKGVSVLLGLELRDSVVLKGDAGVRPAVRVSSKLLCELNQMIIEELTRYGIHRLGEAEFQPYIPLTSAAVASKVSMAEAFEPVAFHESVSSLLIRHENAQKQLICFQVSQLYALPIAYGTPKAARLQWKHFSAASVKKEKVPPTKMDTSDDRLQEEIITARNKDQASERSLSESSVKQGRMTMGSIPL